MILKEKCHDHSLLHDFCHNLLCDKLWVVEKKIVGTCELTLLLLKTYAVSYDLSASCIETPCPS